MRKEKKINFRGTTARNGDAVARLTNPGDCAVVYRGRARSMVMACPEGCGSILTINLDRRAGKAWDLYQRKQKISVFPSYWRVDGCRCHFIIWRDKILWCDSYERFETPDVSALHANVLEQIPTGSYAAYIDIAIAIDEVPWDVLWACRSLVRCGLAIEGINSESFKRIKSGTGGISGSNKPKPGGISILA